MDLGAVVPAGLAAGLLGLADGLALGEGSGLTLPARVASSSCRRRPSFSACRSWRRHSRAWQPAHETVPILQLEARHGPQLRYLGRRAGIILSWSR